MITQMFYGYHNQIKDAEKWLSTVISRLFSVFPTVTWKNNGAVFANQLNNLNPAPLNWCKYAQDKW